MAKFSIFSKRVSYTSDDTSDLAKDVLTYEKLKKFIEMFQPMFQGDEEEYMAYNKDNPAKPPYNAKMTITYLPDVDAYKLNFSYWSTGVLFIKSTVPTSDRMFDYATKEWTVSQVYFDNIKMFFEGVGYIIKGFTKEDYEKFQKSQYEAQRQSQGLTSRLVSVEEEFNKFKELLRAASLPFNLSFPSLTKEEALKFYRKMAFIFHPDKNNGDARRMTELNVTWDNLKKYHFKESS